VIGEEDIKAIFNIKSKGGKVHVQTFANDLREPMTAEREEITIEVFDKICGRFGGDVVHVDNFRKSFIVNEFKYSNEVGNNNVLE